MYNPSKKDEPGEVIRVAIADDHILFRQGVKTALSMQQDIRMVADADNGMQLLNLLKHITPDVILIAIDKQLAAKNNDRKSGESYQQQDHRPEIFRP